MSFFSFTHKLGDLGRCLDSLVLGCLNYEGGMIKQPVVKPKSQSLGYQELWEDLQLCPKFYLVVLYPPMLRIFF